MATKNTVDVFITFEGVDPEVALDLLADLTEQYDDVPFQFSTEFHVTEVDEDSEPEGEKTEPEEDTGDYNAYHKTAEDAANCQAYPCKGKSGEPNDWVLHSDKDYGAYSEMARAAVGLPTPGVNPAIHLVQDNVVKLRPGIEMHVQGCRNPDPQHYGPCPR